MCRLQSPASGKSNLADLRGMCSPPPPPPRICMVNRNFQEILMKVDFRAQSEKQWSWAFASSALSCPDSDRALWANPLDGRLQCCRLEARKGAFVLLSDLELCQKILRAHTGIIYPRVWGKFSELLVLFLLLLFLFPHTSACGWTQTFIYILLAC